MPGPSRPMASSQGAVEHERDPRPSDGRPPRRTKPRAAHPLALLPATRKRRQHLGGQITPPAHGARRRARAGRSAPITTHTLGGSPLPARTGRCRARAGGRGRSRARGAHPRAHQKSSKIYNFFQTNPTHSHQHHPPPPKNHHHPPKSQKNPTTHSSDGRQEVLLRAVLAGARLGQSTRRGATARSSRQLEQLAQLGVGGTRSSPSAGGARRRAAGAVLVHVASRAARDPRSPCAGCRRTWRPRC